MPESLDPRHKAPFSWSEANPLKRLRLAMRYKRFVLFSLPFACTQISECVYQFIIIYTKRRYEW